MIWFVAFAGWVAGLCTAYVMLRLAFWRAKVRIERGERFDGQGWTK